MELDEFAERMAGVRRRFASKLASRIADVDAALPRLVGNGSEVAAAVLEAHRRVHDLCGIGPTVGFTATGQAARVCERVLLAASRGARGLTESEMTALRDGLDGLRTAADADMNSSGIVE
jgi:chemotaxis protein histidine kinase CheA